MSVLEAIKWTADRHPVLLDDDTLVWVNRVLPGHDRDGDQCFIGCLDDPIRTNKHEIEMKLFKAKRIKALLLL